MAYSGPTGPAQESDAILATAAASLANQRAGGRRATGKPIGQRSAAVRRAGRLRRTATIALATLVGLVLINMWPAMGQHWPGWLDWLLPVALLIAGLSVLARNPVPRVPTKAQLNRAPARQLVAGTQLWLEAQRPQLPAPALDLVGQLGGKLDLLATQLDRLNEDAPAVAQLRSLVGKHLPEVISAYTAIPATLRATRQAGASPDDQLTASLTRIGTEIDSATRQLAEDAIDRLAVQTRYLDLKYGGLDESEATGAD